MSPSVPGVSPSVCPSVVYSEISCVATLPHGDHIAKLQWRQFGDQTLEWTEDQCHSMQHVLCPVLSEYMYKVAVEEIHDPPTISMPGSHEDTGLKIFGITVYDADCQKGHKSNLGDGIIAVPTIVAMCSGNVVLTPTPTKELELDDEVQATTFRLDNGTEWPSGSGGGGFGTVTHASPSASGSGSPGRRRR